LIKQEENGLIFKHNFQYLEAQECFDAILHVAIDSKQHQDWKIEVETAHKCLALTHLSNFGIVQKMEELRFDRLAKSSAQVKSKCLTQGRCPKCTLKIPCKHYSSAEEMFSRGKIYKKHEWF
jgi:hypothetical protein